MHSIVQNLEVKIYVVWKFKRHRIKNLSNMLRIAWEYRAVLDWNYS